MNTFLNYMIMGNAVRSWLMAIGILIVSIILVRIFKALGLKRLRGMAERTSSNIDDLLVTLTEKVAVPFLYVLALYLATRVLDLDPKVRNITGNGMMVVVTWSVLRVITSLIGFSFRRHVHHAPGETREKQARGIMLLVNVVIWTIGVVFLIDNFGYNITTIITGLGVGGIAIALAAQAVLGDLFSYLVIFFDKPFEIGDFIIVDDKMGSIEYIGIKTTRIRTLSGEQLICSNSALTSSWVHNYKRMEKRRIVFSFRVTYQTPNELLKRIPAMVKRAVEAQTLTELDRAHFLRFGDSSLDFEVVYYVLDPDYNKYMDRQQAINLSMKEQFEAAGIEFAYPTRTLYLQGQEINGQWHN